MLYSPSISLLVVQLVVHAPYVHYACVDWWPLPQLVPDVYSRPSIS